MMRSWAVFVSQIFLCWKHLRNASPQVFVVGRIRSILQVTIHHPKAMIWGRCGLGWFGQISGSCVPELMANLQLGDPGFKIWLLFDGGFGKKIGCPFEIPFAKRFPQIYFKLDILLMMAKTLNRLRTSFTPSGKPKSAFSSWGLVDSATGWIFSQVHIGFIYQWHLFECCASSKNRQSGVVSWRWLILSWTGQAT